jgi:ABC-2 type transport system permease protein
MLWKQTKYSILAYFREVIYPLVGLGVPVICYIVLGIMFDEVIQAGRLAYYASYTPSFIVLLLFGVAFISFGCDLTWRRQLRLNRQVVAAGGSVQTEVLARLIRTLVVVTAGFVLLLILAFLQGRVVLSIGHFLGMVGLTLLCSGVLMVYAGALYRFFKRVRTSVIVSVVLYLFVLFIGGFIMPLSLLPAFLVRIAYVNPLYHLNVIYTACWNGTFVFSNLLGSAIYLLVLAVVAVGVILGEMNWRKEHHVFPYSLPGQ